MIDGGYLFPEAFRQEMVKLLRTPIILQGMIKPKKLTKTQKMQIQIDELQRRVDNAIKALNGEWEAD